VLALGLGLALVGCGSDDDPAPIERDDVGCGATDFSACGYTFDDLTDELGRPAYTSPFATALPRWRDEALCAVGTMQRGRCADGKDFLYYQAGDAAEVRYYDADGRPVAVAVLRPESESVCGDPCPRESFFGALADLGCAEPDSGVICGMTVRVDNDDLPYSSGAPLNGCVECSE
jgi:hypothetical protein